MQELLIHEMETSLSPARLGTYLNYCQGDMDKTMKLYVWNIQVSALFWPLLNLSEVILRNRIVLALEKQYGLSWVNSGSLEMSLPNFKKFKPKDEFVSQRKKHKGNIGKIVADLPFAFWQHLLTARYGQLFWNRHLYLSFPHLDSLNTIHKNRDLLYKQIGEIRELRNRIAHHEPIFQRNLPDDYHNIMAFFAACQSPTWIAWLQRHQTLSALLPRIMQG